MKLKLLWQAIKPFALPALKKAAGVIVEHILDELKKNKDKPTIENAN